MLSSESALSIDKSSAFGAVEKFSLSFGEQLEAESAPVKVVLFFLKEDLKLLHE
jgi:hypothetical protein